MTLAYFAKITKQGDRQFLVEFPDLPGCLTEGHSLKEALENAQEALNGYLASLCDRHLNIKNPKVRKGKEYHSIDVDIRLAFAISLRQIRKKHGYTQSDVARKLHISQQAYAKLETPDANPSLDTIEKISKALGSKVEFKLVS